MRLVTLFFPLLVMSVHAAIPTPSLSLPSLTQTSSAPTSSSQIPKCVLNCGAQSLASSGSNCTSFQSSCICTDTKYQDAMNECLKDCTTAEQLAAKALQKSICMAVPSSSQSGSGALAVQIDFAQSSIFALIVTVAGVVMGGLLI